MRYTVSYITKSKHTGLSVRTDQLCDSWKDTPYPGGTLRTFYDAAGRMLGGSPLVDEITLWIACRKPEAGMFAACGVPK